MIRIISIAAIIAGTFGAVGCGTTVQPGQIGVSYRAFSTPALQNDIKREGFYFQWPWNDVVKYTVTWQSKTETVDILTADDLHVQTQVTVTYRPRRDQIYRVATEIGPRYYDEVIRPPFVTIARSEFALHRHNDLAKSGLAIEEQVLGKLRAAVAGKPVEIDRVTISHVEYDRRLTDAISEKLSTAQKVEQKESELRIAERDADIARTAARGRADSRRIEAEGQASAIVLEGEAQAKAQSAITKTLTAAYLRYKAFDSDATRYYFVPVGKDGMPLIVNTDTASGPPMMRRSSASRGSLAK